MKQKFPSLNSTQYYCLLQLLILALFTIVTSHTLAIEGVITVLNAPVWKKPDSRSKIIQYLRKGEIVKIIDVSIIESQYVPIWDNLARPSYIKASHVYFFTQDSNESNQKSLNLDPTDYRKDEPLPFNAPLPVTQEGNFR